jgi:hypothetical protein
MIYFIQDSTTCCIKIGYTANSAGCRMATFQTGNPSKLVLLAVMPGEKADERNLHVRFDAHRHPDGGAEWFKPAPPLLQYILRVVDDPLSARIRRAIAWLKTYAQRDAFWEEDSDVLEYAKDDCVDDEALRLIGQILRLGIVIDDGIWRLRGDEVAS